jgi:GGDEF domain-containing protein
MKMTALPSTEDLRYMLATAKESKKMVELPFKYSNGNSFTIKVIPPQAQFGPKWTFCREDGAPMWTRESADVMMIQNKMKIDAISTLGSSSGQTESSPANKVFRPTVTGNNIPAFQDPLQQNPFAATESTGFGGMGAASTNPGWMPASDTYSAPQTFVPTPGGSSPATTSGEAPAIAEEADATKAEIAAASTTPLPVVVKPSSPAASASSTSLTPPIPAVPPIPGLTQPGSPGAKPASLPPPVELDAECEAQTLHALGNPDTGLMDFVPFSYFLLREFSNHKRNGVKLAAVVFDFRDKDSFEVIDLPIEALEIVSRHIKEHCTNFEVGSRMPSGEFVILLSGLSSERALLFAETLWEDLTQEFMSCFGEDPGSLRMGVSAIPEFCADPGVLLSTAQQAKELARRTGRPTAAYQPV